MTVLDTVQACLIDPLIPFDTINRKNRLENDSPAGYIHALISGHFDKVAEFDQVEAYIMVEVPR